MNNACGRFSYDGEKVFYGYQLVAWKKFGREALELVPAVKASRDDIVISHICGTR